LTLLTKQIKQMIVARLKPDGQSFHYCSIDITPEQLHDIRCDKNILDQLTHLTDWERDYLIYGIIPHTKMTEDEYFQGFDYKAFSIHRDKRKL